MKRFVFLLVMSSVGLARTKTSSIPLLPPRDEEETIFRQAAATADAGMSAQIRESSKSTLGVGLDFGVMETPSTDPTDWAGMRLSYGGRLNVPVRFLDYVVLKPGIGWFRRTEGIGNVSVANNFAEFSLAALLDTALFQELHGGIGVAGHYDLLLDQVSVVGLSSYLPPTNRYRVAPAAQIEWKATTVFSILTQIEYGWSFSTSPVQNYGAATAGIVYYFK